MSALGSKADIGRAEKARLHHLALVFLSCFSLNEFGEQCAPFACADLLRKSHINMALTVRNMPYCVGLVG
jgi:hypothetical protein